jgi:hypothetical protein
VNENKFGFAQGAVQPGDENRRSPRLYLAFGVVTSTTIEEACKEAVKTAERLMVGVRAKFNGTYIHAWPESTWEQVREDWSRAHGADVKDMRGECVQR